VIGMIDKCITNRPLSHAIRNSAKSPHQRFNPFSSCIHSFIRKNFQWYDWWLRYV